MGKTRKVKNVIIIGAASGIGKATVEAFNKEGYGLALGDIEDDNLMSFKEELVRSNRSVWTKKVDVADPKQVTSFVEDATQVFGHFETMVYSVGIGRFSPIVDMKPDQWNNVFAVNLHGAFYFAQAVARQMICQKSGGALLFLSSTAAIANCNQLSHYCVSKAGLNMLVKCLASELGNYRIRANAVMPGVTETSMTSPMINKRRYAQMLKATVPAGRWAQANEIADFILFLASDKASYINGQSIAIDGGHTTKTLPDWWPLDFTQDQEINWTQLFQHYPFAGKRSEK